MLAQPKTTHKILIVDDHPMVREALSIRISLIPELEVCGESDCEDDALNLADQTTPDLVLVDISLRSGNGIELVRKLTARHPKIKCLVVSAYPESLYAERALRAGAVGYLNKQESQENITAAIKAVISGKRYISPQMTQHLVNQALGETMFESNIADRLSNRELQVFQLIGQGLTSSAIATELVLSIHTVDTYREKIKQKIGVKNSVELQREAVRWVIETT